MIDSVKDALAKNTGKTIQIKGVSGSRIADVDLSLKESSFWNTELHFDFTKFGEGGELFFYI